MNLSEILSRYAAARLATTMKIIERGGTVAGGFEAFPSAIDTIPSGGGGDVAPLVERGLSSFQGDMSRIGEYAFASCVNLIEIKMPECLEIRAYAFAWCGSKLTSLSFPKCQVIGSYAFQTCDGLISVEFPDCKTISANAFRVCSRLADASFPKVTNIFTSAFSGCSALRNITIGTGLSSTCSLASSYAFSGCTNLTSIFVPMSLVSNYKTSKNWSYFSAKIVGV